MDLVHSPFLSHTQHSDEFVQAEHARTIKISVLTNLVLFSFKKQKIRQVEWRADPVNCGEPDLVNTAKDYC